MYYKQLRADLKDAAKSANARRDFITHPNASKTNPVGVDVVSLGPVDATQVVVITSGIHGIELSLGSQIQTDILESEAKRPELHNPDTRLVLVHALNPIGTVLGLRTDEKNIDPNRNFVDLTNIPTTPESYRILHPSFTPKSLATRHGARGWKDLLKFAFIEHSVADLGAALAAGQYEYNDGLYYGGNHESWTRKIWKRIVNEHVNRRALRHVWHIDLHTGQPTLKYGEMKKVVTAQPNNPLFERVREIAPTIDTIPTSSFTNLSGDIVDFWPKLNLPNNCDVTAFAIEIGTVQCPDFMKNNDEVATIYRSFKVLNAMMRRNALRFRHCDRHPDRDRIIATMQATFAPNDPKLVHNVLHRWSKIQTSLSKRLEGYCPI